MSSEIVERRFSEFLKAKGIDPTDDRVSLLFSAFREGVQTGFEIADLDEYDEDPNA